MSTITDRVRRATGAVTLVLAGWFAVMVALPFLGGAGRELAVVGDPGRVVPAVLAAGGTIVEVRGRATLARSERSGFAAALYAAGAPLVLEGRIAAGCGARRTGA